MAKKDYFNMPKPQFEAEQEQILSGIKPKPRSRLKPKPRTSAIGDTWDDWHLPSKPPVKPKV